MTVDVQSFSNLDFNIATKGSLSSARPSYTNIQRSAGETGDVYTFSTGKEGESMTLSESDIQNNVKDAEKDQNKLAEEQNKTKDKISETIEKIEETIENEIKNYESQLQSKISAATQEYKNSIKNQDKNERKSFSEFLTQYLESSVSAPSLDAVEELLSQKDTLVQEMTQKADTLSQVSTAINSLKVQFNMKDKADKKDNPFSTSASTEGSANESDFMNFVASYNTEIISENANSSINSTFLTVVSKANFSEEGEEKQEEKIEAEIKEQQEVDIMATEEAKIEYKVEEDGKTSEEAEKEVKEEKGETEEIERQEKEDLKNSIMTTDAEKAELEKEEEETK